MQWNGPVHNGAERGSNRGGTVRPRARLRHFDGDYIRTRSGDRHERSGRHFLPFGLYGFFLPREHRRDFDRNTERKFRFRGMA